MFLFLLKYSLFKWQLGSLSKYDFYQNRNYEFTWKILFLTFSKIRMMKDICKKPRNLMRLNILNSYPKDVCKILQFFFDKWVRKKLRGQVRLLLSTWIRGINPCAPEVRKDQSLIIAAFGLRRKEVGRGFTWPNPNCGF